MTDVRMPVRVVILQDLKLLAEKGPHMWSSDMIDVRMTVPEIDTFSAC